MDKETNNNESLQLFEDQAIRTAWDEQNEEWYFSVVDVVGVLTESPNPNNYWKVLKKRLKEEGNESVTNCNQLKLKSPKDGKRYATDVANTEQLLRIIQSEFKTLENSFTDYIAVPKANMYQSLHITIVSDRNVIVEIQIRTEEMHRRAEYGIAAHWRYKAAFEKNKLPF